MCWATPKGWGWEGGGPAPEHLSLQHVCRQLSRLDCLNQIANELIDIRVKWRFIDKLRDTTATKIAVSELLPVLWQQSTTDGGLKQQDFLYHGLQAKVQDQGVPQPQSLACSLVLTWGWTCICVFSSLHFIRTLARLLYCLICSTSHLGSREAGGLQHMNLGQRPQCSPHSRTQPDYFISSLQQKHYMFRQSYFCMVTVS
jgi:hypothetical protein